MDSRLTWARRLAIAGLVLIAIYHVDEVIEASGLAGFLPISNPMLRGALFEISALALSTSSFALSWTRPSIILSIILLVIGTLMTVDAIAIGTKYFSIMTVPGPIVGFFYGLTVFSLGIAKALLTAAAMKTPPMTKS